MNIRFFTALLVTGLSTFARAQVDLNGLWFPAGGPGQSPRELPLNDFARKLHDDYIAAFAVEDDPGEWCVPPGLPRSIWGAPSPVEIVQTEGFIAIFWEDHSQYRKIYMDEQLRPDPVGHTGMGYSTGHWEGETLVVETTFLREYPYMRKLPNTDTATTIERFTVENRTSEDGITTRYITNQLTLTDERLYTEPVTVTSRLRWSPETPVKEYSCSEEIYDRHLQEKGLQVPDFSQ